MVSTINKVELEMSGRDGELKYYDISYFASAYVEISGAAAFDLLVRSDSIDKWSNGKAITTAERETIIKAFKNWANETQTRCE